MNYNLVEGENKSLYYVKENMTDQVIKSFKEFNEARKFLRSLNLGAGFAGWTPSFVLREIKYQKVIKSKQIVKKVKKINKPNHSNNKVFKKA